MVSRESVVISVLRLSVPVGLGLVALAFAVTTERLDAYSRSPLPLTPTLPYAASASAPGIPGPDTVRLPGELRMPVEVTLRRGQTLETLLERVGVPREETPAVSGALAEHVDPRRLHPGDRLVAFLGADDRPEELEMAIDGRGRVRLAAAEGGWSARLEAFRELRRVRRVRGTVEGSLAGAVVAAGAPEALAYQVAEVLQWDLDFSRDLRRGDRFEVLYEEVVVDGRLASVGDVLALSYHSVRATEPLEAYRAGGATGGGGYYDRRGRPLAKMFLRSPLRFSRVTSRFNRRRFHPVLKTYRPHYGVDYGAPVGTPVRATAAGTVTFAGWDRGGGKTVKIRHARSYLTGYLHLSRFAEGIRPGQRVAQGQVIGHVGSTGLSTAPHLDYRVQHQGRWIDPLGIDNVRGDPLAAEELDRFFAWRDALRASLETGEPPALPEELREGLDAEAGKRQLLADRDPGGRETPSTAAGG